MLISKRLILILVSFLVVPALAEPDLQKVAEKLDPYIEAGDRLSNRLYQQIFHLCAGGNGSGQR